MRWLSGRVSDSGVRAAVLCPWARHFTPRKYWLITQEAVAPSRHDWKIVDWDVKPQHKQKIINYIDKIVSALFAFRYQKCSVRKLKLYGGVEYEILHHQFFDGNIF